MAEHYEDSVGGKHAANLYRKVAGAVDELNPSSILDVGCGKGNLLSLLDNRKRSLAGADLSPEMIKHARQNLGGRVDLKVTDSESLPWNSSSFDAITCTDSFHHYPNPEKVLSEMSRILKAGGHLVIADPWCTAPWRWIVNLRFKFTRSGGVKVYSTDEWNEMLEVTGFRVHRVASQTGSILLVAQKPQ